MNISQRDQELLDNAEMQPMSWAESKVIAQNADLTLFRRSPRQLRDYLEAKEMFQRECGDTATFILRKKLQWEGKLDSSNGYLENRNDVLILLNDYPYYFEDGIDHLVIWSKVRCECNPATEQPTKASAERIEGFIAATFEPLGISRNDIIWFKNTVSLQSVPTLEHFHILIKKKGWESVVGTAGHL